jgi:hypothetical protein
MNVKKGQCVMHECVPLKREYLHGEKLANGHYVPVPANGTSQANPRLPRQPCQIVAATNTTDTTDARLLVHTLNGFHPEPY